MDKTKQLKENESRLFISFIKPHKAVTSSSIARWLRTILEEAGIDYSIFGAHSTRGASASAAARGGVTLEIILKAANWCSESVFQIKKWIERLMEEPSLITRIAWKKLQTTQLMCEIEPSEI